MGALCRNLENFDTLTHEKNHYKSLYVKNHKYSFPVRVITATRFVNLPYAFDRRALAIRMSRKFGFILNW